MYSLISAIIRIKASAKCINVIMLLGFVVQSFVNNAFDYIGLDYDVKTKHHKTNELLGGLSRIFFFSIYI